MVLTHIHVSTILKGDTFTYLDYNTFDRIGKTIKVENAYFPLLHDSPSNISALIQTFEIQNRLDHISVLFEGIRKY